MASLKIDRSEGFYWVKYQGAWTIAEWTGGKWLFLGDIGMMNDDFFDDIHEEKIEQPK